MACPLSLFLEVRLATPGSRVQLGPLPPCTAFDGVLEDTGLLNPGSAARGLSRVPSLVNGLTAHPAGSGEGELRHRLWDLQPLRPHGGAPVQLGLGVTRAALFSDFQSLLQVT